MQSTPRTCPPSAKALLAVLGLALVASLPVAAKQSDRQQPADVTSTSFDGSQQPNGKVIWTGKVVITQGTLKITGDKATGFLDANNSITRIIVDGKPATIHQLDDDNNPMDGQALNIDYKVDQDYAVLTGNAKVKQPVKGSAEGDKLTYNTKDSTMTGESAGGAPVHMTFQPKNPPPGAAPAQPAKPTPSPKKP
jgi:lipopolysaccharide export system protein LptA